MQSLSRTRLLMGFLLAVVMLPAEPALGQGQKKKAKGKDISFNTCDGVKISGTLYANPSGKKDAVVMLLHDFDLKNGGSSSQAGWAALASRLHAEGFTVLAFDFRGFGDSTSVSKDFWTFPYNSGGLVKGSVKKPENIRYQSFNNAYLRYLVNDIAAAKAYLDRRNDAKELNSSSVVVIGAGNGATLGAMWLANECRRRRDTNQPPVLLPAAAQLTSAPEVSDIACAIWLTIHPRLGTSAVPVGRWITEAGRKNKVPMAFIYGKGDSKGGEVAQGYARTIKQARPKDFENTGFYAVPGTKLTSNKLLDEQPALDWICKKYLDNVMTSRGNKEQKDRKSEASLYWYTNQFGKAMKISKKAGQEAPQVDMTFVFGQ